MSRLKSVLIMIAVSLILLVWMVLQNYHQCDKRWTKTQTIQSTIISNQKQLAEQFVRHLKWHTLLAKEELKNNGLTNNAAEPDKH